MTDPIASLIDDKTPNPFVSLAFFFIVTSIYCVLCIFTSPNPTASLMYKTIYILSVITGEYFVNLNLSETMCGVRQWRSTFFITIVPWLLIFVVLQFVLYMFPGWLVPFSNTFGYIIVKLMGLSDVMKEILVDSVEASKDSNASGSGEIARALENVRSDNSLLINQFDVDESNFDAAWTKLVNGKIIKPAVTDTIKKQILNFVKYKFMISEYVWNILAGFFVTSVSYNYMLNSVCSKSLDEMKKRRQDYEDSEKKKREAKQKLSANEPTYTGAPAS